MLNQQDRDAGLPDASYDGDDLVDFGRVQTGHDLIEQEQFRSGPQGLGEFKALAPGHGERRSGLVQLRTQSDPMGNGVCMFQRGTPAGPMQMGPDGDILAHIQSGEWLDDLEGARDAEQAYPLRQEP